MTTPSKYGVDSAPEPTSKYGVDTTPTAAAQGVRCPKCNAALLRAAPPTCPTCGTEPFELAAAARVQPSTESEP